MNSLPVFAVSMEPAAEWVTNWNFSAANVPDIPAPSHARASAQPNLKRKISPHRETAAIPLKSGAGKRTALPASQWQTTPVLMAANLGLPAPLSRLAPLTRGALNFFPPFFQSGTGSLGVSVGYADNLRANSNFPVPWQGSPNVVFLGGGPSFDAGAVRLDNLSDAPLTIDSVVIDLGRPGPTFNLWGSFTIPAHNSAILTQTGEFNLDTSDFPLVGCGQSLSPNETRIPKVTVTIAGVGNTFLDTGHILDTGGFDLACEGNESLQWRPIGTTGIQNATLSLTLSPETSIQSAGAPYTATAQVLDAGSQPISNVTVKFMVLSGPNAGKQGTAVTDANGKAQFTYTSAAPGTDILQATVTNATGGSIQSEQVTTTWVSTGPCPPQTQPPAPGTPVLVYAGQSTGEFSDPLVLAAQLNDPSGNALSGRALTFAFAAQNFQATTNENGVATVNIASAPAPGTLPLTVSFSGDGNFNPAQVNTTVTIDREETTVRYLGKTLLGTAVPQQVIAVLTDGVDGQPVPNRTVNFTVGSITAQAVTDASGVASTTLTLGPDQTSGPSALQISFAGDSSYKPSLTSVPIIVYLSTSFVVWGGNLGGLRLGEDVNFWGHSWATQVTGGNYNANTAFKGFADPVNQIHVCEASAGSGGPLDDQCWQSKSGQSFPPPLTVPAYIEVIVSTAINGDPAVEIFGNIAAAAVCQVDPIPQYDPVPGKPGFCKLVAVIEDGAQIFPARPALIAVQNQPLTVLPGQAFTVDTIIANNSGAAAQAVVVDENFDGVTPVTGSEDFPSILNGQNQTASFQETSQVIPPRQGNETSLAYQQRLAGVDGRIFTSTGQISFTDAANEPFVPVGVSSFSRLQLPRLTLGISGPSCVGPGSSIPYKVTVTNVGSAEADNVIVEMQFPDGSSTTIPIAKIPVGTSVTSTFNFVVPAIAPKQPTESDQDYIARLQSIDGAQLNSLAVANWQDAIGNNYGAIEQPFVTITERVPVVITTPQGPATLLPGQTGTWNFTTQNIGGGNASQVLLQIANPDGSTFAVPPFPLPGGQATVASSTFTVPLVAAKQASESDADYTARLAALDNSALNFIGQLNWLDASGNNYGPTHTAFASTEVLPVLKIMLAGPPTASAGDKITYTITLTNNGHATATLSTLTITLPDGSVQNAVPVTTTLAPGDSTTATVNFTVPLSQQAGTIMATAQVAWKDANNNTYGPLSSVASTQVAGIPPAVLASCLPTSSLSVLLNPDKTVTSYVPNGAWSRGTTGIRFVPVEGPGRTAAITTPSGVNSCSSNSVTGQTVCTANNTDVYLLSNQSLTTTLKSGSTGTTGFSGGSCQNCGVAINPVTNQAVIAMGLSGGAGIQFLDLNTNTFAPPVPAATGRISEDISVDPGRGLILSPSEDSIYGLFKTDNNVTNFFSNRIPAGGEFDSAAEDCTTGIAVAPAEFTNNIFITDLTQATFTPGTPGGTWTAPSQVENFPQFSLAAGASAMAVAPGSHLAIVTGEFGGTGFGVLQLPATSGTGTPAILDWVAANVPNEPTGVAFQFGLDPHTVTAYTSPTSGKALGLVADGGPAFLAVIDLQALLSAHRSQPHQVDPTIDLVAAGIIRFIPTAPVLTKITPASGQQGQQNLAVTISGLGTNFVQGTTTVSFGSGITVTGVTVNSPTSVVATINIDPTTIITAHTVTVTTGSEVVSLANGFNVTRGPAALTAVSPTSGQQGQQGLSVTITGTATHFAQGQTSANFGGGISVTSLTVSSPTSATAIINIDPITSIAGRTVTLTTAGESASGVIFNVTQGPAKLTLLSPNTGPQGQQNLLVAITGQATHFQQTVTTANFGTGITVSSLTVNSATSASAVINVAATATLGSRTVTLTTSGETASIVNGFTVVTGVPVITAVSPNNGKQGQQAISVAITGAFTHFASGTSVASFGNGISVASLTVNSPTSATAVINIDPAATTGGRNVTITTGSEVATLTGGFTVNPGTPVITNVNPNTGAVGQQGLSVTVTAQFTHFVQGSTTANFGGGITVASVTVNSPTSATVVLNISTAAAVGLRTVQFVTSSEVVTLTNGFNVTTAPVIAQINPGAAQQGTQNLSVAIIGQNTHFVQGTTTASFGAGISVLSVTVNSATSVTTVISIDPLAVAGARDVTLTTGTEIVTRTGGFIVLPPPPQVSTTLPEGTVITTPTPIIGSVTSGNWSLQYALASADGTVTNPVFITFASGTTAVNNATLGTLDPTTLLNGNYIVQLVSTDQFGQTSVISSNVDVQGNAKVGNFTLAFNDLTVPVSGLPIAITRTYDSRDKATRDFGVGWSLSISNVRVQKNGKSGANWEMTQSGGLLPNFCLQPTKPHIVTITFPGGAVYKFQGSTNPQCQQIVPIEFADLTFVQTPTAGNTAGATLQVVGDPSTLVNPSSAGPVDLLDIDTLDDSNPTVFQLTTAEGYTYIIDQTRGVTSFTDPSGNQITVNPTGVTSSAGKSVVFTRDTQGRITKVTDPAGKSITYTYNAAGDLTSVTDRAANTSTYTYDATHLLTNVVDPRGIQAVRNTYDASGRLISTTDPSGNTTTFTHDVAANHEIITDRLGNSTLYEYDDDGNILRVTDPLGNVRSSTFDANDNRLSDTNALGKTTSYTYDAAANQTSVTDPLGNVTHYSYNNLHQPLTITDTLGRITTNAYDANGRLLSTTDAFGNTISNSYNAQGLLLTRTDSLGKTTTFAYDAVGNISQQTDALGHVTTYTYDANGNRLTQSVTRTKADGTKETLTTQFQYDGNGRLTKTIYPDGSSTQTIYNGLGQKTDVIDPLGHKTHYDYDANGRLITTTYPDGTTTSSTYDANDQQITSTDQEGRVTSYTYDPLGRQIKTTYPDGSSRQTVYDAIGQTIKSVDELGNATIYAYDGAQHQVSTTDALGHITTFTYDAAGNRTSMTDALGNTTQFVYDKANRKIQTLYPDGTSDSTTFDALGRPISKTDQAGKVTQMAYDALTRLTSVTDALGNVTGYAYDEVGNRISQTDANNHVTKFVYDQRGRKIAYTLPLGQTESYSYDAAGNLISRTDFRGKVTTYSYDPMNRLLQKTPDISFSAPAIGFTYTPTGQRASMSDASGATTYSYDKRDRLLARSTPSGTLTYTYDSAGNLLSTQSSHPGGAAASYSYDQLNRLAVLSDVSGVSTYAYNAVGNLATLTLANGVATQYSYNTLNRLLSMGSTNGTTAISSYAYTLGPSGNKLSVAELSGRQAAYGFDDLYRLTSETISGAASQNGSVSYQYDAAGNRLAITSTVAAIPSGVTSYDANDRITTDVYDANGNTISTNGTTNVYDFENHLIQNGGVSIVYDGDGNRVSETVAGVTTNYLVDTNSPSGFAQVLEELQSGSVVRAYSYGLQLVNQRQIIAGVPSTSFYGFDGTGSVRYLTDSLGSVTDTYDYDVFGNLINSTGSTPNNYLYQGQQFDPALHVYYNRARYLDTTSGRFLTVDPYLGNLSDPLSLHRYLYARLDPVDRSDPSGQQFSMAEVSISIDIDSTLESLNSAYYSNLLRFTISALRCIYCLINPGYKLQSEALNLLFDSDTADVGLQMYQDGQDMIVEGYQELGHAAGEALVGTATDFAIARITNEIKISIEYAEVIIGREFVYLARGSLDYASRNLIGVTLKHLKEAIEVYEPAKGLAEQFLTDEGGTACKALYAAELVSKFIEL
ncbi:MAG TPA: RHS repeat-associated core domain-containing protein [Candidatus Angelobacter sp.]|nr:RHS repeat-associated core domain-containing protein [Candidatus Angelobacter sp.]